MLIQLFTLADERAVLLILFLHLLRDVLCAWKTMHLAVGSCQLCTGVHILLAVFLVNTAVVDISYDIDFRTRTIPSKNDSDNSILCAGTRN